MSTGGTTNKPSKSLTMRVFVFNKLKAEPNSEPFLSKSLINYSKISSLFIPLILFLFDFK